jgi:hypothetical protein
MDLALANVMRSTPEPQRSVVGENDRERSQHDED